MKEAGLLLYGGRVLTMDPSRPRAEAVATSAGRILAVGGEHEIRSSVSPHMERISCQGRIVLPGFIDPHLHLFSWASRFFGVDLCLARSIAEIKKGLGHEQARLFLESGSVAMGTTNSFYRRNTTPPVGTLMWPLLLIPFC